MSLENLLSLHYLSSSSSYSGPHCTGDLVLRTSTQQQQIIRERMSTINHVKNV